MLGFQPCPYPPHAASYHYSGSYNNTLLYLLKKARDMHSNKENKASVTYLMPEVPSFVLEHLLIHRHRRD